MRSTSRSLFPAGLTGLVLAGALCLPASGQASRSPIQALDREIITSTQPLTAEQSSQLAEFTAAKLAAITTGDAAGLVQARDAIIQDARRPGVTGLFLRAYSGSLVPGLRDLLEQRSSEDPLFTIRTENALRILAYLRTPESVELLVSMNSPRKVADGGRRLVAAGLVPLAVESVPQSGLNSRVLTGLAREISNNLLDETDWLATLEDLRAMNAIALNPGMSDQNRTEVRSMQFKAYDDLADRIKAANQPDELVLSIHRAMLGLRARLLDNATAGDVSNRQIAGTLRGMLVKIAEATVKQWSGLQKSQKMYVAYEGTLRIGAQLLSLLEGRPDDAINALANPMNIALDDRPGGPDRDKALANLKSAIKNAG